MTPGLGNVIRRAEFHVYAGSPEASSDPFAINLLFRGRPVVAIGRRAS